MHINFKITALTALIYLSFFSSLHANQTIPDSYPLRNPFEPSIITPNAIPIPAVKTNSSNQALHSETIYQQYTLNYVQAMELKEALQNICVNSKISAEPISNSIIFSGSKSDNEHIKQAIQNIDLPSKQITLEAKIISLNNEATKNLGVNWSWDALPQRFNNTSNKSNTSTSNGNFKFWRGYSFNFAAVLNALCSNGQAKILATPRIITLPNKKASIFIGEHIPVQTEKHNSSGDYTATEYIDAGIKLEYTPVINKDGSIVTAAVHTEVSTPTLISEIKNYKITSRTADTNVRMRSGETLIIGGLINDEEQRTLQKLPFLGDIPILGNLFKNRTHTKTKTEVILILTPYISAAGESPAIFQASAKTFQETANKEKQLH